jgi:hypothetical protein
MIVKIVRIVVLVLLLAIVGFVIFLRITPEGRETGKDLAERWQEIRHGGAARDAGQKLIAMKVRLGTLQPDPSYVTLDCSNQSLGDEGFRLVGKCFHLKAASFIHTDLNDDRMKYLANLTRLASLTIAETPALTDAGIKYVASMPEMESLLLRDTGVGDDSLKLFGRLSELRALDLSSTRVTDAGLPALSGLKKLQWLVLMDVPVTDDGVVKLQGLSSLKQLTLRGSKVTAKGKEQLLKMYPGLTID